MFDNIPDRNLIVLFSKRLRNINLSIEVNNICLLEDYDYNVKSENNQEFSSLYIINFLNEKD